MAQTSTSVGNRAERRRMEREHVFGGPLLESDFAALARCAILRQHAEEMCRRVDSPTGAEMFGQNGIRDCAGIVFLIRWPGVDQVREYLLRRDNAEVEDGKPQRKYLWPPGRGNMLLFPPGARPEWLDDPTMDSVFCEGPKKLLALWNLAWHGLGDSAEKPRFLPIAVSGVWNFRGRTGKTENSSGGRVDEKGLIDDFARINFKGRETTIWYDRNVWDHAEKSGSVAHARNSFAKELRKLGARVLFSDLPADDQTINGIDDYAGTHGLAAALELYETRYDPKREKKADHIPASTSFTPRNHEVPIAPILSAKALYGLAGDAVRVILPCSEANDATLLMHLLIGSGNAMGGGAYFKVENTRHYTNLFYCAVGDTSRGRKGTAHGQVRPLLAEADPEWARTRIQSGLSSGEGLIAFASASDGVKSDKRLLAMATEFAAVLKAIRRDGNTLSAVMRDGWDHIPLQTMTKHDPMRVDDAHISVIGHITKDELKRALSETESANGFGNRFLWARSERSKYLPEGGEIDDAAFGDLATRLKSAVVGARAVQRMKRDKAATELWAAGYRRLSEGVPGLLGALTSLAEAQVLRLSMIYALLDCSSIIRLEHLEAVLAVWQYCFDSAKFVFGSALGYSLADKIWNALRAVDNGLSRTQIYSDVLRSNSKSPEIDAALTFLEEKGLAHRKAVGDGRNITEIWCSGPQIEAEAELATVTVQ